MQISWPGRGGYGAMNLIATRTLDKKLRKAAQENAGRLFGLYRFDGVRTLPMGLEDNSRTHASVAAFFGALKSQEWGTLMSILRGRARAQNLN